MKNNHLRIERERKRETESAIASETEEQRGDLRLEFERLVQTCSES